VFSKACVSIRYLLIGYETNLSLSPPFYPTALALISHKLSLNSPKNLIGIFRRLYNEHAMWKLTLFGPPTLSYEGRPQPIQRRKGRALLAYLALTQQSHSRESLVTLLWPEYDPPRGHADLSRTLFGLRKILGTTYFTTDREIVALNSNVGLWVDVIAFRRQMKAYRSGAVASPEDSHRQILADVVDLYQADFLAGFTLPDCPDFDEWQLMQTEALRRDLGWALEQLIRTSESQDELQQVILHAQRWVRLDPLNETAQRCLIELYARHGMRVEALRQYQTLTRLLAEDLGVEPQPETQQLNEMIRSGGARKDHEKRVLGTQPAVRAQGTTSQARSQIAPMQPGNLDPDIRFFFSFDNVRIAYGTVGEGPPLVMTATFLRHLQYDWQSPIWQHWLEMLTSEHTLIRYDERACGLSDWNVSDISFEAWVHDLEALVEKLNLDRFRLLALSQAGAVAIAYAVRHPEKVSHLILHGAYARGRFHREDIPGAREEAQTMLSLTKLGWGRDNPAFRQVFSLQLMPDATKEQLAWYDELMRVSMTPENAVRAEAEMYNINVVDLLPEVSVPTLVTHCRYDAAVPFAEGVILASQIPGARFVPLDSNNHLLLPSEPAWKHFVNEIHRFVAPTRAANL
jgi:DNA-binding SARP family transcriptional activator/pimeloyl-ACP methyl ester carboxylesterase